MRGSGASASGEPDGGQTIGAAWQNEESRIRAAYGRRTDRSKYSWFDRAHMLATQRLEEAVLSALGQCQYSTLEGVRVLDVGCGRGAWINDFVKWGARPENLSGVDLLPDRIEEARRRCPEGVTLRCASAARLDFDNSSFDIVVQSMLFSSVLDQEMRRATAAEMLRVVRSPGLILWYDFHVNNPRNRDVRGVSRQEIHGLFPGCRIELHRVTLAAPVARWIAPRSRAAWSMLSAIPWLRTHYLAIIQPPPQPGARLVAAVESGAPRP